MPAATTPEYDTRYNRAQTIKGAKARYVTVGNGYGEQALEADIERLLREGDCPDYRVVERESSGISPVRYEKKCPTCGEWAYEAPCEDCQTPESILGATEVF